MVRHRTAAADLHASLHPRLHRTVPAARKDRLPKPVRSYSQQAALRPENAIPTTRPTTRWLRSSCSSEDTAAQAIQRVLAYRMACGASVTGLRAQTNRRVLSLRFVFLDGWISECVPVHLSPAGTTANQPGVERRERSERRATPGCEDRSKLNPERGGPTEKARTAPLGLFDLGGHVSQGFATLTRHSTLG